MPRGNRRERERQRRRSEILDAAERVFARKSFHAATMTEVAENAEFAVGSLYNFFRGKDELYIAMVERVIGEYEPLMHESILAAASPLDALERIVALKLDLLDKHKGFVRAFFGQALALRWSVASSAEDVVRERYASHVSDLEGVFQAGVESGVFVEADAHDLALAFESITNALLGEWVEKDDESATQGEIRERVEKAFGVFLRGAMNVSASDRTPRSEEGCEARAEGNRKTLPRDREALAAGARQPGA